LAKIPFLFIHREVKDELNKFPQSIKEFLPQINFEKNLAKIRGNCSSSDQFRKAFYQWFNGFTVLKYVHFARDNYYENIEILNAVRWLFGEISDNEITIKENKKALELLRLIDKSQ
jgi:hypothetical protein